MKNQKQNKNTRLEPLLNAVVAVMVLGFTAFSMMHFSPRFSGSHENANFSEEKISIEK